MHWWQLRRRDADLERELQSDLELEEEEQRDRGLPPEEARYAARRAFGNPTLIRERTREAWGWAAAEHLWQDVRYGFRQCIRNPGFTLTAVLTLAVGVGINTTIFSVVSAILLRKPPVNAPDTLCAVSSKNLAKGYDLIAASAPDFESWQKQNSVFGQMAAVEADRSFTITGKSEPASVHGDRVTAGFFATIGVMPILGRAFLPSENQPGNDHEVILSDSLWRQRFARDAGAVGQSLEIDGAPYRIVGVMPPLAYLASSARPQLWTPLVFTPDDLTPTARANHFIDLVLGRLNPGVSPAQAQNQMDSIGRRLAQQYATTNKDWGVTVLTLQEHNIRSENARNGVLLLMYAVALVLLIACVNVAGLLLTRGVSRSHEFAVRSALGASRGRILRQTLIESVLIGASSGLAGLLISFGGIRLLRAGFDFNAAGERMGAGLRIDMPTFSFALTITLLTTVFFGLLPAIRSSKTPPGGALGQAGRSNAGGKVSSRLRKVLVVTEVTTAVVLLAAAGVVLRELLRELSVPNGFNDHRLFIATLDVSSARYKHPDARIAFFRQAVRAVQNLPEVESADVDSCVPMGCSFSVSFSVVGQPPQTLSRRSSSDFSVVGPDYFQAMQIPHWKGRDFTDDDNAQKPVVAVVNRQFARRFFPNQDPIGKRIEANDGNHKQAEIVGIVGNVNNYVGQADPHPRIYESYRQIPVNAFSSMSLVIRGRAAIDSFAPALRRAVWSIDPAQPVEIRTMEDLENDNLGGDKLMAGLMGLFGALALGLAGLGIYGVIAYSVAQRTREIGIRVSLGARKSNVLGLVLREGAVLIAIGSTIGTVAALSLPALIRGVLNGVARQGPLAILAAALAVVLVAFLATYIPAFRAMNTDPVRALRMD